MAFDIKTGAEEAQKAFDKKESPADAYGDPKEQLEDQIDSLFNDMKREEDRIVIKPSVIKFSALGK